MNNSVNIRKTDRQIKNLFVNGHRTSLRLEIAFWEGFETCAREQGKSIHQLANDALGQYAAITSSLSSAVRLLIINYFREKAAEVERKYRMDDLAAARLADADPVRTALSHGRDFLAAVEGLGASAVDNRDLRKLFADITNVIDRPGGGSR
jgi:predicted DNA-binding ribbon-helix-helix protein